MKELGLTREQKIEILRRWAYGESEIAGAEEEGMSALPALMMLICRTRDCSRQTSAPGKISQNDAAPTAAAQQRRTAVPVL